MKKTIKTKWGFIGYFVDDQPVGIQLCKHNKLYFCIDYKDDIFYITNSKKNELYL